MRDGIGAGGVGDFHLVLRDERPGDAGAQQVILLVNRMRPQHGEAELLGEFLAEVFDDDLIRAGFVGLIFDALELIALAQLGRESNEFHAGIAVLKPGKNDAGIQPAAVGEDDLRFLHSSRRHYRWGTLARR